MEINISQPNEYCGTMQMIGQFWEPNDFVLFQEHIKELLDKGGKRIVIDLSRVSFISSQGLGLLVTAFNNVKERGGELIMLKPKGCVKEMMEISGFNIFMKIVESDKELG